MRTQERDVVVVDSSFPVTVVQKNGQKNMLTVIKNGLEKQELLSNATLNFWCLWLTATSLEGTVTNRDDSENN